MLPDLRHNYRSNGLKYSGPNEECKREGNTKSIYLEQTVMI